MCALGCVPGVCAVLMLRLFTLLRPIFATGPVLQTNANAPPAPRRAAPAAARPQPALPPAAAAGVGESAFEQAFAPLTVGAVAALAALFQFVSLWTAVTLWALALATTAWRRRRRRAAAPPALVPAAGTPAQRQPARAPAAAAAPVPELPQIGEIRFDNPRLRLGEGSFGVVFRSAARG